jgi:hypothetical protein
VDRFVLDLHHLDKLAVAEKMASHPLSDYQCLCQQILMCGLYNREAMEV